MSNIREYPGFKSANSADELPSVSIIIPSYNRATLLKDTLQSLLQQRYQDGFVEIIVVDNSSTDNTEEVVHDAKSRSPFPLHYYRKEPEGPAAARNHGIARSNGEVIGFTDSDCTMGSEWILNAVKHIRGGADFVAGPILPVINPERAPGFLSHQVDEGRQDLLCRTANMFYRRQVLEKLGGFDERFGVYPWGTPMAGEDTDLAWRARKNGYRFDWAEDAQVFHEASAINLRDWLMEPFRMINVPMLVASAPELREVLLWRYFSSQENVVFYPLLLGTIVAILIRQPFLLLLALPWFWMKRSGITSDLGSPKRWWRIPVKYALLLERAVLSVSILIYSSVRYRSIVL